MTGWQRNGRRLMNAVLVASSALMLSVGSAGATTTHHTAVPAYSAKAGIVPNSQRVQTTLHASPDSVVVPAPRQAVADISQRQVLFSIHDFSPVRVDGRTFYPSVLFGLLTNSAMQYACNIPGLTIPTAPSTTPTTACQKGLFYQRTPVWVVTQRGVCSQSSGGPVRPPGDTTTTQPTTTTTFDPARCVGYTFVSATTGKDLYGEN